MSNQSTILNGLNIRGYATKASGKAVLALLVVLCLGGVMKPANAQLQGGVNDAAPLQGGVEHAEKLPPVEKRLQSGSKFDEGYLTNVVPNNMWIPIPSWFAGVWETRTETQLESTDLTGMGSMGTGGMEMIGMGGMNESFSNKPSTFARIDKWVFGMQVDKFGQVWHFINVPSYRKVQVEDTFEHRQEVSKEFLYVDDARVVTRYRFTAVIADGQSKKIQQARQQETMLIYKAATPDTMRAFGSIKLFSQEGLPLMLSKNYTPFYRLKPFAPIPVYHGIDMRRSFRDYLLSHKLTERIPDDLKNLDDDLPRALP